MHANFATVINIRFKNVYSKDPGGLCYKHFYTRNLLFTDRPNKLQHAFLYKTTHFAIAVNVKYKNVYNIFL